MSIEFATVHLDKTEILFIRACKSEFPYRRVLSVYRRFYCRYEKNEDFYICGILASLCDKKKLISIPDLITSFHESVGYQHGILATDTHWVKSNKILISSIRYTDCKKFNGQYISTARIRRIRNLTKENSNESL